VHYYVNQLSQSNGDHEVHTASCSFLPLEPNRIHLGDFTTCAPAVAAARRYYTKSNGCAFCAQPCNTG
jgi:hypothetical protein